MSRLNRMLSESCPHVKEEQLTANKAPATSISRIRALERLAVMTWPSSEKSVRELSYDSSRIHDCPGRYESLTDENVDESQEKL